MSASGARFDELRVMHRFSPAVRTTPRASASCAFSTSSATSSPSSNVVVSQPAQIESDE
jgi:hypothetical protein